MELVVDGHDDVVAHLARVLEHLYGSALVGPPLLGLIQSPPVVLLGAAPLVHRLDERAHVVMHKLKLRSVIARAVYFQVGVRAFFTRLKVSKRDSESLLLPPLLWQRWDPRLGFFPPGWHRRAENAEPEKRVFYADLEYPRTGRGFSAREHRIDFEAPTGIQGVLSSD